MTVPLIRPADPDRDAAACAAIYAPHVDDSHISFEDRAPDATAMAARIERTQRAYPWVVAERDGEVTGFAYADTYKERPAYRWAAAVSVYVGDAERNRGTGRALYLELFDRLRRQNFRIARAGITLPNPASVALHHRLGFVEVGISRAIGWTAGAWRDVALYQLDLAPPGEGPPPEPLPPG
ncbi:MAG: N-acetyltransferase family protein [Solirubrobacterales bacterium]